MLAFRESFQRASRYEERVDEPVAIVVQQRGAAAEGFDDVILPVVPAAIEDVCQARFRGNIGEDGRIVQRRGGRHRPHGRGQQTVE